MEVAGFTEVEVEYVTREMVLDDFSSIWAMLTVGALPIKMIFDKVGAEGKDRIRDALASIIEKRYGNSPISISNEATIGNGNSV